MSFTLSTIYKGVDKYTPVLKQMERANASFAMKQDAAYRKVRGTMTNMGNQALAMAGGLSVGSLVYKGTTAVIQYDEAMQSLSAVTGVSGDKFVQMKTQIKELALTSNKSMVDVAKGFEIVGSNMSEYLDNPKGLRQITEAGIILSKAARMDLEPALDSVTSVMNQFGFAADKANFVIQKLTAGEIVGNVRTSEMSEMLKEFGANAKLSNVSLEESVALVQTLGKFMNKAKVDVASRNILTILSAAEGLDTKALGDFKKAGVNVDVLMDKGKTLSERLNELKKISGSSAAMVHVFGKENITAGQIALNNIDIFDKFHNQIKNTNEAEVQAGKNAASFANLIKELGTKFDNLLILGNENSKTLDKFGKVIVFVTNNLDKILVVVGSLILAFGTYYTLMTLIRGATIAYNIVSRLFYAIQASVPIALAASSVALKAYAIGMQIGSAVTWLFSEALWANPITWIVIGIIALVAAVVLLIIKWKQLVAWFKQTKAFEIIIKIIEPIKNAFKALGDVFSWVWEKIKAVWEWIKKIAGFALEPIMKLIDKFSDGKSEINVNSEEKPVNTVASSNEAQSNRFEEISKQQIGIELTNKTDKNANVKANTAKVPFTTNTFN